MRRGSPAAADAVRPAVRRLLASQPDRMVTFAPCPNGVGRERIEESRTQPLAERRHRLPRAVDGGPRRDGRQRRAAVDPARPQAQPGEPPVGRQRLHADLRRLPAARRPTFRPVRPAAAVLHRRDPVQRRVADRRARELLRDADRRARPAGYRRGAGLAGDAGDRQHDLPRRGRPAQGAEPVGGALGRRRGGRTAARRGPDAGLLVAVDLLRQRADRRRRGGARAALRAGRARRGRAAWSRHPRRVHHHRRARAADLRDRQDAELRLGLGQHAGPRRRRAGVDRRVRRHRGSGAGAARSARHLPHAGAGRRRRRDVLPRSRAVRELLLRHALPSGDPALHADRDRLRVPARGRADRRGRRDQPAHRAALRRPRSGHRRHGDRGRRAWR